MPLAAALAEVRRRTRAGVELYGEQVDAAAWQMERSYRHSVYCSAVIDQAGNKLTGRYCGNRWCLVCNRVRTGMSINRYLPTLTAWGERRYFVTLTAPNVSDAALPGELRRYRADFTGIKRAMKRTHKTPLVCLRKLECTYNQTADTYHPHFHCIVQGRAAANLLRTLWLETRGDAVSRAQDVRKASPNDVRELFKYFTKLVTRSRTGTGQTQRAQVKVASAERLDVIFSAMRGLRVFQPVGFTTPKTDDDETATIGETGHTSAPDKLRRRDGEWPDPETDGAQRWTWYQEFTDWISPDGEALAEYSPSDGMRTLVAGIPHPTEDIL